MNIILVMALSTTKYIPGIAAALFNVHANDWSFLTYYLSTVGGGMIGVIAYDLILLEILDFIRRKRGIDPRKIRVNKHMRRLVRLRKRFGLVGIAALTPIFLQVPIGTVLAGTIEPNTKKVALYMFVSFSFYSILFYVLNMAFDINPQDLFDVFSSEEADL